MTDDIPTTAPLPVERDPGSRRVGGPRDGTPSAPPAGGTRPRPGGSPSRARTRRAGAPPEPRISFDDFMKVRLQVARVLVAEVIPKSGNC